MNNYQDLRSPGQNQVWSIAKAVLEEFPINPITAEGSTVEDEGYSVYETLLNRLKADPIVRKDLYTGRRIIKKDVATSYVNWLFSNATKSAIIVEPDEQIDVDFNSIFFDGSSIGTGISEPLKVRQRIYQGGGSRPVGSTARAVLTLVRGDKIPTDLMDMSYLRNSKILRVTGGNHRAIAYKLLGLKNFPSEKVKICNDYPDEKLNQALLHLESLYTLRDPRETPISISNQSDVKLALKLGEEYGAYSPGTRPSELYCFTKRDLFNLEGEKTAGMNTTALDLLNLYAKVYKTLPNLQTQAWWQRLFQSGNRTSQPALGYKGDEIQQRWLERRVKLSL